MTNNMRVFVCIAITFLSFLASSVLGAEVAVLTDANFEHDTQATTGGTTGSWLVLFHDGDDSEIKAVLETPVAEETPEVPEGEESPEPLKTKLVDDLLEEGIVAGMMDLSANPKTAERLNIP